MKQIRIISLCLACALTLCYPVWAATAVDIPLAVQSEQQPDGSNTDVQEPEQPDGSNTDVQEPEQPDGSNTDVQEPEQPDGSNTDVQEPEQQEIERDPTVIKVIVPDLGKVLVNPYRMSVDVGGQKTRNQIVHIPQYIKSESNVPLLVNVTTKGTVLGKTKLVSHAPSTDTKENALFLYLELQTVDNEWDLPQWASGYTGADNQCVITAQETRYENMLVIEPGNETPTWVAFRLNGSTSLRPAMPWTAKDSVDVTLTFSFQPVE